jgi:hypothetical protein
MAQLRRFFYCRLTLAFALTVFDRRIIAIRIDIARGGVGLRKSSPSNRAGLESEPILNLKATLTGE